MLCVAVVLILLGVRGDVVGMGLGTVVESFMLVGSVVVELRLLIWKREIQHMYILCFNYSNLHSRINYLPTCKFQLISKLEAPLITSVTQKWKSNTTSIACVQFSSHDSSLVQFSVKLALKIDKILSFSFLPLVDEVEYVYHGQILL